ncbi:MAG TPA: VOC family protein [Terriglobales bacterium]|jgi:methylmalonyl-CoA/ethylmalonyl-CoA epimerase|nr:VOC family protein [Terriglobales bacterium]
MANYIQLSTAKREVTMASATQLTLNSIGQIAILVKDVARATAFYREKLGIKYLFAAGNLAFFDCGGIRLMLDKPERPDMGTSVIYFKVPEINEAYEEMRSRGVEFEDKPHLIARLPDHELWMTFFRDSEGNLLSLMSEVRAQA